VKRGINPPNIVVDPEIPVKISDVNSESGENTRVLVIWRIFCTVIHLGMRGDLGNSPLYAPQASV